MSRLITLSVAVLMTLPVSAQVVGRRPFIRAFGDGVASSAPDSVKVNVGLTTQADTAQASAEQNAAKMTTILTALRQLLGSSAEIRTVTFSINPVYRPATNPPVLTGYSTTNIVEVTVGNATTAGRVIDTATQAGANVVQGLRFALRDTTPLLLQALRLATQRARATAETIASGLGSRVGSVVSVEQGIVPSAAARSDVGAGATASVPTPVEAGQVEVRAYVTIEVELQ
ncbi:MAG: SIMPL domain-containing protein [Bryobacterales bacterium]|nr:SIMPL domain-containing protein [Bryobacterales bacterium]